MFRPELPSCTALEKRQSIDGCAGFKATSSKDGQRRACRAKRSVIVPCWDGIAGPIGKEGKGARFHEAEGIDGGLVAANLDGCSLWLRPEAHTVSVWVESRHGLSLLPIRL